MSKLSEKTTIYLHPTIKEFIQHKAVSDRSSVSKVINDYFADLLEDLEDLKIIENEKRRDEKSISFDKVLSDLGLTYDDLRS